MKTIGYAAKKEKADLAPFHFERRDLRDNDVAIDILYCGVCHSDLHQIDNDWEGSMYPLVPGHEIVGKVTEVGSKVKDHKVGDKVAVGCFVDSCMSCDQCDTGHEHFCREGVTATYNSEDKIMGGHTYGGFSKHIVVRDHFVLSVPDKLDLSKTAPILCAGITTYSPLKDFGVKEGTRVGVIGLGGLGHMAVKLAKGMKAEVTVITRSEDKIEMAKEYGADHVIISKNEKDMKESASSLDLIINTVPVKHDINPYLSLLDVQGKLVIVGQIGNLEEPNTGGLVFGDKSIGGSLVGGIPYTQEVLNFCAEHDIYPKCEMISMDGINKALEHLKKGDVAHRYVIDMETLKE